MKLICGDCNIEFFKVYNSLSEDEQKRVVIVTDPPFNIGYKYNTYKDNMDENKYYQMLGDIISNTPSAIINYPENLYKVSFQIGYFPTKVISWVYNSNTAKQHRDIAFFNIKPDMSQVRQPYKNPTDKRIKERIARGCEGAKLYDWWNINQVKNVNKDKTSHPCQMPLEVMNNLIGILPHDSIVIDPFMGSGTTGLAVLKMNEKQHTNREFIGIEIDKEYYNIAKSRLS